MAFVNDLLNKISDFKCVVDGKEIAFPGILQEENGNVVLNAKFPLEQYRKIGIEDDIVVLGEVSGRKATLMGCHITSASCTIGDNDISIYAVPNEIIVGGCFSSTPMAKRIIVSTPDLNYMFSGASPLEPNVGISKDNPSVLNYTFPKPIVANDKYGEIQISQSFGTQWAVDYYKHNIISISKRVGEARKPLILLGFLALFYYSHSFSTFSFPVFRIRKLVKRGFFSAYYSFYPDYPRSCYIKCCKKA